MDGNQSLDHQLTPFTDAWLSLEAAFEGAMAPELGGLWTLIHWTMVLFAADVVSEHVDKIILAEVPTPLAAHS